MTSRIGRESGCAEALTATADASSRDLFTERAASASAAHQKWRYTGSKRRDQVTQALLKQLDQLRQGALEGHTLPASGVTLVLRP